MHWFLIRIFAAILILGGGAFYYFGAERQITAQPQSAFEAERQLDDSDYVSLGQKATSDETAIGGEPTSGLAAGATVDMSPGEEKFYQSCDTECHGPRDPQTFTKQEWRIVTMTMFEWANVEEDDRKLILDFLIKNASDAR